MQVHIEKGNWTDSSLWTYDREYDYEGLQIQRRYEDDMYQEIKNEQDSEFKTLWSSIGGLVEIFLGVPLSHTPQLMLDMFSYVWSQNGFFLRKLSTIM